jgi:hypothetical protein
MKIKRKLIVLGLPILLAAAAANADSRNRGNLLSNMRWCVEPANDADGPRK